MNMIRELTPGLLYFVVIYTFILYPLIFVWLIYRRTQRKKDYLNIKKHTMDFCFKDTDDYRIIFNTSSYYKYNEEKRIDEIHGYDQLTSILFKFEKISIAVKNSTFDETIIREFYWPHFMQFYIKYKFFILKLREKENVSYLFIEYETLLNRWMNTNVNRGRLKNDPF